MMHASENDANRRLYLDDLHVGQRFVSDAHALDKGQVIAFASQFDPQSFHLDDEFSEGHAIRWARSKRLTRVTG